MPSTDAKQTPDADTLKNGQRIHFRAGLLKYVTRSVRRKGGFPCVRIGCGWERVTKSKVIDPKGAAVIVWE